MSQQKEQFMQHVEQLQEELNIRPAKRLRNRDRVRVVCVIRDAFLLAGGDIHQAYFFE